MIKKRLRDRLPYGLRKLSRRLIVRLVGSIVHVTRDILNIATTNGLDLQHEWKLKDHWNWDVDTDAEINVTRSWSVQDFLFLMDLVTDRQKKINEAATLPVKCSIIIPVCDKVNYTFQCLRSLIQEIGSGHEIIVVNNGSSDGTERLLSYLQDAVSVVNNSENQGFIKACNQGAAAARGKYLVFLNNDTVIQPEWLKHLVETIEEDATVGAVGSMLLHPNGCLQEAGGITWKNGDGQNYGRGENPQNRKFRFAREVDYCSAVSLLVRKDLFDALGGFDERYAPAYYEDVDLCFGIRSLGCKVIYQPLSRLIHYEGTTAGNDVRNGVRRYQKINQDKFVEKWQEVLQRDHLDYRADLVDRTADRRRGLRIIVFDHCVPAPDQDSGSLRMFLMLKTLAKIGRPVFVPVHLAPLADYENLVGKEGVEVVLRADYKDLLSKDDFQIAILSRVDVADDVLAAIRAVDSNIKIVFDTVDLHFLRLEREYEITGEQRFAEEATKVRKQEIQLASSSAQVWCVTSQDKEVLERDVPTANIKVIPNIHVLHDGGRPFCEREGLLFIGNFNHRPNRDALRFYRDEIAPQVQQLLPGVQLYVVGSNMPDEILAYASEHIVIKGYVPDVASIFQAARLFVAPLRYGSGMKGKIGQAMSYGLPVITSSIGAEGFQCCEGPDVMIADEPAAFAQAIVKAYMQKELWLRLSENGYKHIGDHFTPQIVTRKIVAALAELNGQDLLAG